MKKIISYYNVKFTQVIIQSALNRLETFTNLKEKKHRNSSLIARVGKETWHHDNESEFFTDYNKETDFVIFSRSYDDGKVSLYIVFDGFKTDIEVIAPMRSQIEEVHQIFQQNVERCLLSKEEQKPVEKPIIFLGHGRSSQWRELKDHLQDKHGYKIEAYEVGARAGHTIRDILEEMLKNSSIAFIVMTAEDKDADGTFHARENVIHELGLFQGKLGFHKAIAIVEEGTNEFSNLHGIQQLRYSKGNIKEIYGDVIATLKRENS